MKRTMRNIILFALTILLFTSCSKKEMKFEAFSPEAFAYDLGDGNAEVNASVRVKGFTQTEKSGNYSASINYNVDLIKPDSSVVKAIFKDVKTASESEPINDLGLEAQFDLDSTYINGEYKLVFNIKDNYSSQTLITNVGLKLSR